MLGDSDGNTFCSSFSNLKTEETKAPPFGRGMIGQMYRGPDPAICAILPQLKFEISTYRYENIRTDGVARNKSDGQTDC
jgi:hypothetical protein